MLTFLRDESGQGVLEYGLILGLVAMLAIGAVLFLGSSANNSFVQSDNAINSAIQSQVGQLQ